MLTNETSALLFSVYCFSGSCSRHYVVTSFRYLKIVVGAGSRLLFFYSEYISGDYLAVMNVLKFLSENASFGMHI